MRKTAFFALVVFFFSACSGSFQSRWTNFRAYYNTFYNAKTQYELGVNAVERTKVQINPARPIRVYQSPAKIGAQNFEKVVEKSAIILREHPNSKWVDDAGLLIGKSYFFLTQFFGAEEKFDEILFTSESEELRQESIFWKGRTMLEMKRYAEGRQFLLTQLNSLDYNWQPEMKAKIYVVLAEISVEQQDYEQAKIDLAENVGGLPYSPEKARAAFLLGQLHELDEEYDKAQNAYELVVEQKPPYELLFLAQKKFATIARESGQVDEAMSMFRKMLKDDKNFDIITEIQLEVGKTLKDMNKANEAESYFKTILYRSIQQPSKETKSQTYFSLGELARDYYTDYTLAAAYFDSAAKQSPDLSKLPEGFNAAELATAFGAYSKLSSTITKNDSLMYLSTLTKQELDSVVLSIYQQRKKELEEEEKQRQKEQNTFATGQTGANSDANQQSIVGEFGFLNYKNPSIVADARASFNGVWGSRPLTDNWRRSRYLQEQGSAFDESMEAADTSSQDKGIKDVGTLIDLSEIPFSDDKKITMNNSSAEAKYQLGNLFYLTLDNIDSARNRYREVIYQHENSEVRNRALFTLSELERTLGNALRAEQFATMLIQDYPQSYLSRIIAERNNLEIPQTEELATYRDSVKTIYSDLMSKTDVSLESAYEFKHFADSCKEEDIAVQAYWNSSKIYLNLAKSSSNYDSLFNRKINVISDFNRKKERLNSLKDSAKVVLADSLISKADSSKWAGIKDSTIKEPNFDAINPYKGQFWDSTRVVLGTIIKRFPKASITPMAKRIADEIKYEVKKDKPKKEEPSKPIPPETIYIEPDVFKQIFADSLLGKSLTFEVQLDTAGTVVNIRDKEKRFERQYFDIQAYLNTFHKLKGESDVWKTYYLKSKAKKEE